MSMNSAATWSEECYCSLQSGGGKERALLVRLASCLLQNRMASLRSLAISPRFWLTPHACDLKMQRKGPPRTRSLGVLGMVFDKAARLMLLQGCKFSEDKEYMRFFKERE